MFAPSVTPRVVVGVDGSRAAIHAALWAIDEAIDRDAPLCLLYAIDEASQKPSESAASAVATAEQAVRSTITAIESLRRPVKIEAEIVRRRPIAALQEASRSAALVCLGSIGHHHATHGRIGSTAATLAHSSQCPVAIVPRTIHAATGRPGLVLAIVNRSSPVGERVVETAAIEAQLRSCSLRVLAAHEARPTRPNISAPTLDQTETALQRRIARCRAAHPGLDVEYVCSHDGLLNFLEHQQRGAAPIQLAVVDPQSPGSVDTLLGPAGRAVLESTGCVVMACDRTGWL